MYVEDKGTLPSGCLDLSQILLEVNWIYYCTFFMDGIKILPEMKIVKFWVKVAFEVIFS